MKMIITIIGSSTFGAIISFLFTWITNRKTNSLNYITEERRKWRDKIREIITGIEESKFEGKDKRNIKQYLIQLEVNINPYGRYFKIDYVREGHIWEIINKINESKTKIEFENYKSILLDYLTLMLKKDWERSKTEVRGYSYIAICIGVVSIFLISYAFLYFYILKLEKWTPFLAFIIINMISLFYMKFFFTDELDAIKNSKKMMPLNLMIKKERKTKKILIQGVIGILAILIFNIIIGEVYFPKAVSENMLYCKQNGKIFLYSNIDTNLLSEFEGNLKKLVNDKVVIVKNKSELPFEQEKIETNDVILRQAISDSISIWNVILTSLSSFILITGMYFSTKSGEENRKYIREIEKIKYLNNYKCGKISKQIIEFTNRIDFNSTDKKKENNVLLGIVYSLLTDMEMDLNDVIFKNNYLIGSVEEYDDLAVKKKNLVQIELIMKQIKKINRKLYRNKKEFFDKVKEDIENIN